MAVSSICPWKRSLPSLTLDSIISWEKSLSRLTLGILLCTLQHTRALIDKEEDLKGLITEQSIETHEIPLKYDLFRERVLPEFLQTLGDNVIAEYIDKVPEVVGQTQDGRHTTIVYRHNHLYNTVPDILYAKLRWYKWKFRSRRRRTISTLEPSFTLNAKDLEQIRNQVGELDAKDIEEGITYTRNTMTEGTAYPANKLHSYIIKRYKLIKSPKRTKKPQRTPKGGTTIRTTTILSTIDPTLAFMHQTCATMFRTVRRLNRTVSFIPFHQGTWRHSTYPYFTTPYFMAPNYTLPTKLWTVATDWKQYDQEVYDRIRDKDVWIPDEVWNRKRFSLAMHQRMLQYQKLQVARTLNTSYLKYTIKPYKYTTTLAPGMTPQTTTRITFRPSPPGFELYSQSDPWTMISRTVRSDELILRAHVNKAKVEMCKMNKDDDLLAMMDFDFEYPVVTRAAMPSTKQFDSTTTVPQGIETKTVTNNRNCCNMTRGESEKCLKQTDTKTRQGFRNNDQQTHLNFSVQSLTNSTSKTDTRMLESLGLNVGDNQGFRSIKKRSLTTKCDSIRRSTDSNVKSLCRNTELANTTEQTYKQFKSLLLKRLGRKSVKTKATQKYTFITKKIPLKRKLLFKSNVSKSADKITKTKTKSNTQIKETSKEKEMCLKLDMKTSEKSIKIEKETKATQRSKLRREKNKKTLKQDIINTTSQRIATEITKSSAPKIKLKKSKVDRYEDMEILSYSTVNFDEHKDLLNTKLCPVTTNLSDTRVSLAPTKKTTKLSDTRVCQAPTKKTTKLPNTRVFLAPTKKKKIRKSKIEMQGEDSIQENQYRGSWREKAEQNYMCSDEKPKKKKSRSERAEEYIRQMYPPVTVDDTWVEEYQRRLIPTVPHNMSRDEFIRGFYTFGPEFVSSAKTENCTSENQGYIQNDTNLFSSQEMVKLRDVFNLYNKYVKVFQEGLITTAKSRKKTTRPTYLSVSLLEDEYIKTDVTSSHEYKETKDRTRSYIPYNFSNFIYY